MEPVPALYLEGIEDLQASLPSLAQAHHEGYPIATALLDLSYDVGDVLHVFSDLYAGEAFNPNAANSRLASAMEKLVALADLWDPTRQHE